MPVAEATPVADPEGTRPGGPATAENPWKNLDATPISYREPNGDGKVFAAVEYANPYEHLDLALNPMTSTPEREMLAQTAAGSTIAVIGKNVYYPTQLPNGSTRIDRVLMKSLNDLKPLTLNADPIQVGTEVLSDRVTSMTVLMTRNGKKVTWDPTDAAAAGFREELQNPFELAEDIARDANKLPPVNKINHDRSYKPDAKGKIYATTVYNEDGTIIDWRSRPELRRLNRQVMITAADGRQYYLYGDRIFDLAASKAQNKPVSFALDPEKPIKNIVIGESWGNTAPITQVEVLVGKVDQLDQSDMSNPEIKKANEAFEKVFQPMVVRNDIAETAAEFAPHASNEYKLPKSFLAKRAAKQKIATGKDKAIDLGYDAMFAASKAARTGSKIAKSIPKKAGEAKREVLRLTDDKLRQMGAYAMTKIVAIEPIKIDSESDNKKPNSLRDRANRQLFEMHVMMDAIAQDIENRRKKNKS